jgi:hypothetical protein
MSQFVRYVGGYILRPAFAGIEGNDANGVFVLPTKQVEHHGFDIRTLKIGFPENATMATQVIDHEVHVVIVAVRHNRWCPARSGHRQLQHNRTGIQAVTGQFVPMTELACMTRPAKTLLREQVRRAMLSMSEIPR